MQLMHLMCKEYFYHSLLFAQFVTATAFFYRCYAHHLYMRANFFQLFLIKMSYREKLQIKQAQSYLCACLNPAQIKQPLQLTGKLFYNSTDVFRFYIFSTKALLLQAS